MSFKTNPSLISLNSIHKGMLISQVIFAMVAFFYCYAIDLFRLLKNTTGYSGCLYHQFHLADSIVEPFIF